jgi:1,4-dihydroxy-2-naphthoyl-CoA hydrolase
VLRLKTYLSQGDLDLSALNAAHHESLTQLLGILVTAVGPDFIMGEMPVDERTRQPFGLLHGGASIVLAESLGSVGSFLLVRDEDGPRVVGVEVSCSHLRGVRSGKVTGVCRALKLGRTMHFWQINVYDQQWQMCCSARLAMSVSREPAVASGN